MSQKDLVKIVARDILVQLMQRAARRITADEIEDWFANDDQFAEATDVQLDAMSDYILALATTVDIDQLTIKDTDRSTSRHVPEITLVQDDEEPVVSEKEETSTPMVGDAAVLTDGKGRQDKGWRVSRVDSDSAHVSISRGDFVKHLNRTSSGDYVHTPGVYATFTPADR